MQCPNEYPKAMTGPEHSGRKVQSKPTQGRLMPVPEYAAYPKEENRTGTASRHDRTRNGPVTRDERARSRVPGGKKLY